MMKLPVLHIDLPRPVTAIHQIEVTSRCNLRCVYCPSPQIMKGEYPNRPAMDMAEDVFAAALALAKVFVDRGTQHELNMAGIGESTLHPKFEHFLRLARKTVGPRIQIDFATNGLLVPSSLLETVKETDTKVWVSLHRPEKAGIAYEAYRKIGALIPRAGADPVDNAYDWAGQVEWYNSPRSYPVPCQWIRDGKVFVRADGSIATCCVDAKGDGTIGSVVDLAEAMKASTTYAWNGLTQPYALCASCSQEIAIHGHQQRA